MPIKQGRITVAEIARCLWKPRHADTTEWLHAVNALKRLTPVELDQLRKLADQYGVTVRDGG